MAASRLTAEPARSSRAGSPSATVTDADVCMTLDAERGSIFHVLPIILHKSGTGPVSAAALHLGSAPHDSHADWCTWAADCSSLRFRGWVIFQLFRCKRVQITGNQTFVQWSWFATENPVTLFRRARFALDAPSRSGCVWMSESEVLVLCCIQLPVSWQALKDTTEAVITVTLPTDAHRFNP